MKNQKYVDDLSRLLRRRTECSPELFGIPPIDYREAEEVVKIALKLGDMLPFTRVNEQLENELVCQVLRSRGHEEYANVFSMVGIPVEDLTDTITGGGFENHENANLQNNAETSHKKAADNLFKKYYLKLLPTKIRQLHEQGWIHIHDLEYFGTRPFCIPESEIVLKRRNGKVQIATPNTCQIGDELLTPDGWNSIKFITKRLYSGDLITINTACGGMVTTTTEHRIPTVKEVKPCENLILTDELISVNKRLIEGQEEISEAKALFLGSYIADGHSICNDGYYIIISDEGKITKEIVSNFAEERGCYVGISKYPGKCTQYGIYRKDLYFELIEEYGLNTGSSNKSLPKNIFNMPLERQKDIIAAMFYGDGSVFYQADKSSITAYYKTVSKTLAKQLGMWLTLNGIGHRIKRTDRPENGNYDTYVIYITRDGLMKMKLLGEQKEEVEKYLLNVSQIQLKPKKNTIISIERNKFEGDVYDFGLEGSNDDLSKHLFLAGSGLYIRNCFDWDLRYFLYYGLMPDGTGTKASVSGPAKHAEVAVLHAVKALGSAQTNFAGGQGYYNFLTFLAPHFKNLPYPRIKQLMQMFVFEMTQMMVARGGQLVFSSVQLSPGVPDLWKDKPVVANGYVYDGRTSSGIRWTYGDLEPEVRLMFKALMEVLIEGDYWKKPFNFPKPEIVLDREFIDGGKLDEPFKAEGFDKFNLSIYGVAGIPTYRELYQLAFKLAAETGAPYFDNCIPDYRRPDGGEGISCYQCVSQNTLIPIKTSRGIELIYADEMTDDSDFLTPDGVKKAKCITSYSVNKTIVIKAKGGRKIECSPDHTLLVMRYGNQMRTTADRLLRGDVLVCSDDLPENGVMSTKMAYFLGLYTAEGNILIRDVNTGGHRIQFSFSANEKDLAERTDNLLRDLFGVDPKVKLVRENELRVLIYNKELCLRLLGEFGVSPSTGINCHIPPAIFELSKLQKIAFLQGILHGDGSIGKVKPGIAWQFRSEKLTAGLAMLLRSVGYHPVLGKIATRDMYFLNLTRKEEVKSFLAGEILPINSEPVVIKDIKEVEGKVKVYDPVDIDGHNFILASGIVSGNCCSYRFSTSVDADPEFRDKLIFKDGAHFSMGSFQVVTINLPRTTYNAQDLAECVTRIKSLMTDSLQIFKAKAFWMEKMKGANRMPFITQRPHDPHCKSIKGPVAADLSKLAYTFGIVGLEECVLSITGKRMEEDMEAWETGLTIVSEMESHLQTLQEQSGLTLALARTPAETVAGRFAAMDLRDPDTMMKAMDVVRGDVPGVMAKIHSGDRSNDQAVYYTNGTHMPVSSEISIGLKAEREGAFFPILSGGNIMHIFLGEEQPNPEALMSFAFKLARETPVGYFAFTRDFTICLECDRLSGGLKDKCHYCHSTKVDHISRVTGYAQAVSGWNNAKKQELKDRMRYKL